MATAGQTMLDTDGKCILRDDGTKELSDGSGDACCCSLECFQKWQATYDCDTAMWTVVSIDKECLPAGTSTAWTGAVCVWTRYVDMGHTCTSDGDCSGYDDTDPPDPPFGGDEPPSCCPPPNGCSNCFPGATPRTWTVTFDSVGNSLFKCGSECFFGGITGGTGTLGTYTLTQDAIDPCKWTFTGAGPTVLIYHDDPTCSGAPVSYGTITITLTVIGVGGYRLIVTVANPYTVLTLFDADNDAGDDPDCCTGKTFDNTATYDCGHPGDGGTAVGTPHC